MLNGNEWKITFDLSIVLGGYGDCFKVPLHNYGYVETRPLFKASNKRQKKPRLKHLTPGHLYYIRSLMKMLQFL